jgi:hypothetical protein
VSLGFGLAAQFPQKTRLLRAVQPLEGEFKRGDPLSEPPAAGERDHYQDEDEERNGAKDKNDVSLIAIDIAPEEFKGLPGIWQGCYSSGRAVSIGLCICLASHAACNNEKDRGGSNPKSTARSGAAMKSPSASSLA